MRLDFRRVRDGWAIAGMEEDVLVITDANFLEWLVLTSEDGGLYPFTVRCQCGGPNLYYCEFRQTFDLKRLG